MTFTCYPPIQEKQRPVAVSEEASFVRNNIDNCHYLFLGQSVFIKEMYEEQIKNRFIYYKSIWESETVFSSSISEITNNSAYRSIINLGLQVVPFIIDDLKINNSHWFYALEAITGQNPIKESHKGILPLMKDDWIKWSQENFVTDEG